MLPNVIQKPWGHERIISKNDIYVVKEIYVKPNSRLSLQYHNNKIETMLLVSGEGFMYTKYPNGGVGKSRLMNLIPHHIPAGTIHRLFTKEQDCLVVEVSSTELDDVVRLEDDYGREG